MDTWRARLHKAVSDLEDLWENDWDPPATLLGQLRRAHLTAAKRVISLEKRVVELSSERAARQEGEILIRGAVRTARIGLSSRAKVSRVVDDIIRLG